MNEVQLILISEDVRKAPILQHDLCNDDSIEL